VTQYTDYIFVILINGDSVCRDDDKVLTSK